jgi:hypothetical protein
MKSELCGASTQEKRPNSSLRALQEIANMRTKPDQLTTQPKPQTVQSTEALPRHNRKTAVLQISSVFEGERDEYVD